MVRIFSIMTAKSYSQNNVSCLEIKHRAYFTSILFWCVLNVALYSDVAGKHIYSAALEIYVAPNPETRSESFSVRL